MDIKDTSHIEPDFSDDSLHEPHASAFGHLLDELALYGVRPGEDERDHRSLPEAEPCEQAISTALEALSEMFCDTRMEDDTDSVLWSFVNLFHWQVDRIQRELDRNEQAQRRGQQEQDGSEVKAVELERHATQGVTLVERQRVFEFLRETAAKSFKSRTGSVWRPRTGSSISRRQNRQFTSAYIDSRDFINAERSLKTKNLLPEGARIAVSGGKNYQDHRLIWATLDKVIQKHPKMVLFHTGCGTGADFIAGKWADARSVTHVGFLPEKRFKKAAPFKRNDRLLATLPKGLIVFPGSGIQDHLAREAQILGIPVADYRSRH